jgi:hypothetical protein
MDSKNGTPELQFADAIFRRLSALRRRQDNEQVEIPRPTGARVQKKVHIHNKYIKDSGVVENSSSFWPHNHPPQETYQWRQCMVIENRQSSPRNYPLLCTARSSQHQQYSVTTLSQPARKIHQNISPRGWPRL